MTPLCALQVMPDTAPSALSFSLQAWSAWSPDLTTPAAWADWAATDTRQTQSIEPAVAAMPAMLRRRAQRLGRMALETLYDPATAVSADYPIVFASRYGEVQRSTALLQELAENGAVSPQSFSMSVHNAIAGLYTIATTQAANVVALAAGTQTACGGLVEALMLLADGAPGVRLLFCDEPLPSVYDRYGETATPAFACLLVLQAGADFQLHWQDNAAATDAAPLDLLRFILTDAATLALSTSGWGIQRAAAQ